MYVLDQGFEKWAKITYRAGQVLAIVLIWQATHSPVMSQFGSTVQQFPQVVLNGGSTTSFTIHNPNAEKTINVDVQLYSPAGATLMDGQVELAPGETETVSFGDASAALTRGWAELKSDDEFIATEFFQLFLAGLKPRVGVLPSPAAEEIKFLGFVNEQFKSGLAVHNPSPTEATEITLRLKDNAGQQPIAEKKLTLAPLQSEAAFLNEALLFGPSLSSFEGAVEISVNSPPVAVLSLIQEASGDVATVSVEVATHISTGSTNTAIGQGALVSNTTGAGNTASGESALRNNTTGDSNTATGRNALSSNTIGKNNTASGEGALLNNTEGNNNTASGSRTLRNNTTGHSNTAIGFHALRENTEGRENAANGFQALLRNTTGGGNTASGFNSLLANTTGSSNTAIGGQALFSNTEGGGNTAIGREALSLNTTGGGNTASGLAALGRNTTGSRNTASGANALFDNTTGERDTASGFHALRHNTEGSFNTATGDEALRANTTGSSNTATGRAALLLNTTGSNNTANGVGALQSNTEGSNNTALGLSADVSAGDLTNATAIGAGAIVNASDKIRLGNANVTVIEGAVGYTFTSDKTKKENFQPVDGEEVLAKLQSLEIPSWNLAGQDPGRFRHYGPMAQDFFAAFGQDGVGTIGTPTTINTSDLAGILMIAVQTLGRRTRENAELKVRVEKLELAIQKMHSGPASDGSL